MEGNDPKGFRLASPTGEIFRTAAGWNRDPYSGLYHVIEVALTLVSRLGNQSLLGQLLTRTQKEHI